MNKVSTEDVAARVEDALQRRGVQVLAAIPFNEEFLEAGLEGAALNIEYVTDGVRSLLDAILAVAELTEGN